MNQVHTTPSDASWQAFVDRGSDLVEGTVVALAPFGAFVRADEGVDGLLPSGEARGALSVGDRVRGRVLAIDDERRRFSLRQVD